MTFPAQHIPDGNIMAPHHLYIGVLAAYIVCWVASNRMPKREAWATVTALTVALFGFLFVWPDYPAAGASLTLLGAVGACCGVVSVVLVRRCVRSPTGGAVERTDRTR